MASMLSFDGSGSGYGFGYGFGYGSGFGYGDGYGSGFGSGVLVYELRQWDVYYVPTFRVLSIGCESHTVERWKADWPKIARSHKVDITQSTVDEILRKIESAHAR